MHTHVGFYEFRDAFNRIRPGSFSDDGLRALFEHLEELEADTGESIELDVIAICCDFCEYESAEEFANQFPEGADREDALVCELPGGGILAREI